MAVHVQILIETYLPNGEKDGGISHFLAHVLDFLRGADSDPAIVRLYTLLDSLHFA
jgi:hypothetical protein